MTMQTTLKLIKSYQSLILNTLKSENLTNLSLDLIQMINNDDLHNDTNINKNKSKKIANYLWEYYKNNKKIIKKDVDTLK